MKHGRSSKKIHKKYNTLDDILTLYNMKKTKDGFMRPEVFSTLISMNEEKSGVMYVWLLLLRSLNRRWNGKNPCSNDSTIVDVAQTFLNRVLEDFIHTQDLIDTNNLLLENDEEIQTIRTDIVLRNIDIIQNNRIFTHRSVNSRNKHPFKNVCK